MANPCPVCNSALKSAPTNLGNGIDATAYACSRCGDFSLTGSAITALPSKLQTDQLASIKLSHVLSAMTEREPRPVIDSSLLNNILADTALPSLSEQLDNLISWLARNQRSPGEQIQPTSSAEAATGARNWKSFTFLCDYATNSGFVKGCIGGTTSGASGGLQLTFEGWAYFEDLQRGDRTSRKAFMAMKFGDPQLDAVYTDYLKKAVEHTGFELKRNDESQKAGLIDDHMRVEIRQSRFLIADLTHDNQGAYWEAGFAEGLGKPVIYTCRKDVFEKGDIHFDTNHHLTVKWDPGKIVEAMEKLKATIRATLPGEAKLSDGERS